MAAWKLLKQKSETEKEIYKIDILGAGIKKDDNRRQEPAMFQR